MSVIIAMSHLRWNFVYQRPQHLLSRLAKHYDIIFFEEPVFHRKEHLDGGYKTSPESYSLHTSYTGES